MNWPYYAYDCRNGLLIFILLCLVSNLQGDTGNSLQPVNKGRESSISINRTANDSDLNRSVQEGSLADIDTANSLEFAHKKVVDKNQSDARIISIGFWGAMAVVALVLVISVIGLFF